MVMDTMETKNAIITTAVITNEDHGWLSIWLNLNYGGSGQGFGGHALWNPTSALKLLDEKASVKFTGDLTGLWIWRIMQICDVHKWADVSGSMIRVKAHSNGVNAIGHYLNDEWFEPSLEYRAACLLAKGS